MRNKWALPAAAAALALGAAPSAFSDIKDRLIPCLACHGDAGTSASPGVPSLGGQPAPFLLIQLYQFREKQRVAVPMNEFAKDLSDDDLKTFSDELAKLPPPKPPAAGGVADRLERGKAAADKHRCGSCHNPDMSGHDQIPRIGGQREEYLLRTLRGYKSGKRSAYDPAMIEIARAMSDDEIKDAAHYMANWQ